MADETPLTAKPKGLLTAVPEYALDSLGADHVVFCEWRPAAGAVWNRAAGDGIAHPEESSLDERFRSGPTGSRRAIVARPHPLRSAHGGRQQGRRADARLRSGFLDRIGAAAALLVRVAEADGSCWEMEAYYLPSTSLAAAHDERSV